LCCVSVCLCVSVSLCLCVSLALLLCPFRLFVLSFFLSLSSSLSCSHFLCMFLGWSCCVTGVASHLAHDESTRETFLIYLCGMTHSCAFICGCVGPGVCVFLILSERPSELLFFTRFGLFVWSLGLVAGTWCSFIEIQGLFVEILRAFSCTYRLMLSRGWRHR